MIGAWRVLMLTVLLGVVCTSGTTGTSAPAAYE